MTAQQYEIAHLHQPDGWLSPGFLEVDERGFISHVLAERPPEWDGRNVQALGGWVLPGMPNVHSHVHQRGLAGLAEGGPGATEAENFWTWRTTMYDFALRLDPDQFQAFAELAFREMLAAGFTSVAEFHYLHHAPDGSYYDDPFELSERVLAAAETTGIALTLLPSLYRQGGIGAPPLPEQRRFVHRSLDDFVRLYEHVFGRVAGNPLLRAGIAPHSVRAVGLDELHAVVNAITTHDPTAPIHIHVAEQQREVDDCLRLLHARPAEWLLHNLPVDERWTFIHSTHTTDAERQTMAERGVVAGLCPVTEANLGDGIFPLRDFHRRGGTFGIGTDSDIALDVAGELRMLEYSQRLAMQARSVLVSPGSPLTEHPGRKLYDAALAGGAQALSQPVGALTAGLRADLIELDPAHVSLAEADERTVLDRWVFASVRPAVRRVMVGGRWVVGALS